MNVQIIRITILIGVGVAHLHLLGEARAATNPRDEFLAIAEQLRTSDHRAYGVIRINQLEQAFQKSKGSLSKQQLLNAHMLIMAQKLIHGQSQQAALHANEALRLVDEEVESGAEMDQQLDYALKAHAIAHIRLTEDMTGPEGHGEDSCIWPLRLSGTTHPRHANTARESLLRYLDRRPEDYAARWLLNLVSMAPGQTVPPDFRIPVRAMPARDSIPRFPNVASTLGIDGFKLAGAVIVEDFDSDGFLDVITSTVNPWESLTYYRNRGDGRFEDRTTSSRLDQQLGAINAISGDYDNDGDLDLLVLRGGWGVRHGNIRNSLLRLDADGTFADVTRAAGMGRNPMPTQAASWGDFDNDGDLDLYVANETTNAQPDARSSLYRNNGDGTFKDVAARAGVANDRYGKGVTAGDYDNDGDLDLYVSNYDGDNRLYRNRGDGTFEDVAAHLGLTMPAKSFVPWFFDYNNDGWLDLFVAAYDAQVADVAKDYLGLPHDASSPALYRNNRDGTFTDVAADVGLDHAYLPMGANFGDLDNDGFLDMYLGTGRPNYDVLVPNIMLRNVGGVRFEDVTVAGGFGHLQKGHGIAFNDLDHDGDQDIYHQLGGFYPGDRHGNALFLNPGGSGHYLKLQLRGADSNRFGVGARIEVAVVMPSGARRVIHRAVGSVSSFGGSSLARQEIGLGGAARIEKLTVWWPKSDTRSVFSGVPMNTFLQLTEGEARFEKLSHDRLSFIGPSARANPEPTSELPASVGSR